MTGKIRLVTWKHLQAKGFQALEPWELDACPEGTLCLACDGLDCIETAPCRDASGRKGEVLRCKVCDAAMPTGELEEQVGHA